MSRKVEDLIVRFAKENSGWRYDKGASVVVDVTNSPSWDDAAVMKFFETSTRNLLTYEAAAGVGHRCTFG